MGQNTKKIPKIGPNRDFFQPNPRSRKVAIYRSSMKLFASNLTDRLKTGRNIPNLQNQVKMGHVGSRDHFWNCVIP